MTNGPVNEEGMRNFLPRDEVRRLRHPRATKMCLDFGLVWLQAGLGVLLFAVTMDVTGFIVGAVLVGTAQHGLSMIAHEGAHGLIIPKNRRLNDGISILLFAAPTFLPFALYRQRHFAHHRLVSTPEDTKELYLRELGGWRLPFEIARSLSGLDYIVQVVSTLRRARTDRAAPVTAATATESSNHLRRDILAIGAVQLIFLACLGSIDILLYPLMWLLPNITVAVLCAKIRSEVEHHPAWHECSTGNASPYFKGTVNPFIRSVRASWIERIFISKINFHFHGEHHRWPSVSYQYLPEIHTRLKQQNLFASAGIIAEPNYMTVLNNLWSGK